MKTAYIKILLVFCVASVAGFAVHSAQAQTYYLKKQKPAAEQDTAEEEKKTRRQRARCNEKERKLLKKFNESMRSMNDIAQLDSAQTRRMMRLMEDEEKLTKFIHLKLKCEYGIHPPSE